MYDYLLGGKDNFAADREAADQAGRGCCPDAQKIARANREFLVRSVRLRGPAGIRQFVDLGAGLPTSPNVHEVRAGTVGRRARGWCTWITTRWWSTHSPGAAGHRRRRDRGQVPLPGTR